MSYRTMILSLLSVCAVLVGRTGADVLYELTDLGGLGGGETRAQNVNNSGEAIGHSRIIVDQVATWHAYWSDGVTMHDLGTLGGSFSYAYGVNDARQVVGYSEQSDEDGGRTRAFRWTDLNGNGEADPNEMIDLGTLGGSSSNGRDINAGGQVVGSADADVGGFLKPKRAFLWTDDGNNQADPNEMIDLGTLSTSLYGKSEAYGVNSGAAVVGDSDASGGVHAFYWHDANGNGQSDPNEMIDLGTFGGTSSHAYGINDDHEVVGVASITGNTASRAFLWRDANDNGAADPNEMTDLGTLGGNDSWAWGINGPGDVVGWADGPDPNAVDVGAFYWHDTNDNGQSDPNEMIDLNAVVDVNMDADPNNDWELIEARAISDEGHIVGVGTAAGRPGQAFLLTPTSDGPGLPGDVNGDGQVNHDDVDPFINALLNGPFNANADMNGDELVNGLDVGPFLAEVTGSTTQSIPEPSTLALVAPTLLGLLGIGWRQTRRTA